MLAAMSSANAAPGRRRQVLARWGPWVVAAAILGYLLATTPVAEVADAVAATSLWRLALLAAVFVLAVLVADGLAVWLAVRAGVGAGLVRARDAIGVRGASYLLALLSYGAGQGGIVYLLRQHCRVPVAAGAGAVLLASGALLAVVAAAVAAGLVAGAVPERPALPLVAAAVLAAVPIYAAVVWLRPAVLVRRAFLRPLFTAGLAGAAQVAAARAVHLGVLVAGHFLAMRLFGIHLPPEAALARLPVLFFIASLPIAPSGLGTTQAAAVALFAPYAPGETEAAQQAQVLAYSLSFHVLGGAATAAVGLASLARLSRLTGSSETSGGG
jgi:hypothetical protein